MTSVGLPEGTKLGRYEVVKHLARGGMADLAVARTRGLENFERHVVIKHLRPEQAQDEAFVKMFVTEARLAGALHHHNIVQVHDIGQDQGTYYMAMEYVHGEDVRNLLTELRKKGQLTPLEHVVAIVSGVAAALHHAHEQTGTDRKPLGIVHRDVTPGNIIVGFDGNVKVVDFGIAKAAMRSGDTQVGMLKGKVPYMAPEQVTGKPVDRRSDVFALGIVLYELITVRRLFKGGNEFYTMSAVVGGEIPPPSTHRPDLPKDLEAIVMKALSRKPAERFQTAEEMRAALERFAEQQHLRVSAASLATYMKKVFGDRPEPWMMKDAKERLSTEVDFDRTEVGLATVPEEVLAKRELPRQVPTTRGSLIEQARLDVIASELPPASDAKSGTLGDTKTPAPPKLPAKKPLPSVKAKAEPAQAEPADPKVTADRAKTDVDEATDIGEPPHAAKALDKTDVSNPPPMPLVIVSSGDNAARESTAIVTPLPSPEVTASIAAEVGEVAPRQIDRKWLLAGGIGAVALVAALVIVMTGSKDLAKREKPVIDLSASKASDPPPSNTPPAEPEPTQVAASSPPPAEPTPVEPTPAETKPVEPTPVESKPVEPTPVEPAETKPVEPTPVETKPVEPTPVEPKPVEKRPVVRKRPVAKPTPKPATTTTAKKPPTWDPNALFLKPKK